MMNTTNTQTATRAYSAQVHVSTTLYRCSHMKQPRGRGSWAFYMGRGDSGELLLIPGSRTYVSARSLAVTEAASRGISQIEVAP